MAPVRAAGPPRRETRHPTTRSALENTLAPTPEAGPLRFQEGKGARRAAGRWQAHAGVAEGGLRDGGRVQVGNGTVSF